MKVTAFIGAAGEEGAPKTSVLRLESCVPTFFIHAFEHLTSATVREDSCAERMVRKVEMLSQQIQDQKKQANAQTITATQANSRNSQLS